jgi:hypothetical protein
MNYQKHYNLLIKKGLERALSKKEAESILGYVECHHIIPSCLGGANEKSNLVYLSGREHFIAHLLLVKMYPNNIGIIAAAAIMSSRLSEYSGSKSRSFEWVRKHNASFRKTLNKHNCVWLAEIGRKNSITLKGRTKETHEYLRNISERWIGLTKETYEPFRKSSETQLGRTKETHEYLRINGEKRKGQSKETTSFLQIISDKNNILPLIKRIEIQTLRKDGISAAEIHRSLLSEGYDIAYSSIVRISKKQETI